MGKSKYSVIKFNEEGCCPFFTADKLCVIHQKMGGEALSLTCANYPRSSNTWGDQLRHTMSMSCSEVARLVLFEPDSMLQHEEINLVASEARPLTASKQRFAQKNQLIHLFAWNLIGAQSGNIEANLLALAQFILYLQRINFDLSERLSDVETFYNDLMAALQRQEAAPDNSGKEQAVLLKVRALVAVFKNEVNNTVRNSSLRESYNAVFSYLNVDQPSYITDIQLKFAEIDRQWQQLCTSSCLAEPYVIRNYLQYQLYTSYFPGRDLSLIMRSFYRMVIDYFCLKVLLTVKSLHQEITQEDILHLFADYHQHVYHSTRMADKLDNAINEINGGDDLSCLLLLG